MSCGVCDLPRTAVNVPLGLGEKHTGESKYCYRLCLNPSSKMSRIRVQVGSRGHETVADGGGDLGCRTPGRKKPLIARAVGFAFLRERFCLLAAVSVKIESGLLERIRLKTESEKQVLKTVY